MIVEMRARGFSLTPALRAYAERRLGYALDRWRERVARARVLLRDVNGPRGGRDKSCRVEIQLRGGRWVRATVTDVDAYAAIDGAVRRAARAVARAIRRDQGNLLELLWLARAMSRGASSA
ncbi:MAG TPA: HPF/RaiA family ribosome-associated protein [Anaeromyxobacteraceae bacterium]|nr:HPF/RaiA family ribosome-associated protein [Anaeromyxobacteraceae bacterium]